MEIPWDAERLEKWIRELLAANKQENANIKIMCIGDSRGRNEKEVNLYILMLNPLFPPRQLYRKGAKVLTAHGERHFPTAKTLDMLLSAVLYNRAREQGAYDTLLVNAEQCVTEGTRTNLFVTDGKRLLTPPADQTLSGVTKTTVIECARMHGVAVQEQPLPWDQFGDWEGVFLTSTSSKIVPVVEVDKLTFAIPTITKELITHYDTYLTNYASDTATTNSKST